MCDTCSENVPTENVHVWLNAPAFDGSAGVGYGTYAAMMAITPTTEGVGFWVTATETLYRAEYESESGSGGTLAWVPYYTPYTYPHPLRA